MLLKGNWLLCPTKLMLILKHTLENYHQPLGSKPSSYCVLPSKLAPYSTCALHEGKEALWGLSCSPGGLQARWDELEKAMRWPVLTLAFIWSNYWAPAIEQKQVSTPGQCREQCWVSNWFFSSTTKLKSGKKKSMWSKFLSFFFFQQENIKEKINSTSVIKNKNSNSILSKKWERLQHLHVGNQNYSIPTPNRHLNFASV